MDEALLIPTDDNADDVLIFPVGKFHRDGQERSFTPDDAALMVANFENRVLGTDRLPPVNREHKREGGKIGSITALWVTEDGVRGKVEGELDGFDYISPEVKWQWTHPFTGAKHQNVLMGAGATNYPFFLDRMALNDDTAMLWTGSDWEPFQDASREELRERRAARAKRYGIAVKEGSNLTPPKDYPTDEASYLDPVNYRYPASAEYARAALGYFNQSQNREKGGYTSAEWALMGKRGARLISKNLEATYSYKDGRIQRKEEGTMEGSETPETPEDIQADDGSTVEQGDDKMSDELKEQLDAALAKLAEQETALAEYSVKVQAFEEFMAAQAEQETEPELEEEPASDEDTDEYAEQLAAVKAEMEEEFSAQLKAEAEERERFTELYQTERNTRRLAEFTDKAKSWQFGSEVEKFAEDLMLIEDQDAELYGRWVQRLDAINEQMATGGLFEQYSVAGGEAEETDPFEREIEKVRKEQFSDKSYAEGFSEAMKVVERDEPDMARRYAETH